MSNAFLEYTLKLAKKNTKETHNAYDVNDEKQKKKVRQSLISK